MKKSLNVKNDFEYNVVGIGSALLDFTFEVNDEVLENLNLKKSDMTLIDEDRSFEIFEKLKNYDISITAGGSSANCVSGVSNLGGKGIFVGSTGDDKYAESYKNFTEESNVKFVDVKHEGKTGHAITFITPDSERTFATHLGAAIKFNSEDVDESNIKSAAILHFEGFLFESPEILKACIKAMDIAKKNGLLISVDLSDSALIGRIKDVLKKIISEYADIVFANEDEAFAYTGLNEEKALDKIYEECDFAVVKLGEKGSLIKTNEKKYEIPPFEADLVNTNGAGDMYAAGVIYGITNQLDPFISGKIGSYAASLVVSSSSARLKEKIDISAVL